MQIETDENEQQVDFNDDLSDEAIQISRKQPNHIKFTYGYESNHGKFLSAFEKFIERVNSILQPLSTSQSQTLRLINGEQMLTLLAIQTSIDQTMLTVCKFLHLLCSLIIREFFDMNDFQTLADILYLQAMTVNSFSMEEYESFEVKTSIRECDLTNPAKMLEPTIKTLAQQLDHLGHPIQVVSQSANKQNSEQLFAKSNGLLVSTGY